ncbi:unnamed protein product, partial [Ascophyllum nodosum]
GLRPISVCFGRPDVERFITETVEGTAVTAEWADAKKGDTVTKERSLPPHECARRPYASTQSSVSRRGIS